MKSSLKNMVLTLLSITLVSAGALGFVYQLTKEPIEDAKKAKTTGALAEVLPQFDNDPSQDIETLEIDNFPITVYRAKMGAEVVGYAVESMTGQGYSGVIKMIVGFDPKGEIINIEVLEHNETPGLGSKIADPENVLLLSFKGKNPADLNIKVTKDGGDIDVLTASTISSRAYADAVARAYKAYQSVALGTEIESGQDEDAVAAVLPDFDNDPYEDVQEIAHGDGIFRVYIGRLGNEYSGFAIETFAEGYHGEIRLLVGFENPSALITGIRVIHQEETPGFGAVISEVENPLANSFIGKDPQKLDMRLKAEGGDIDAISGSTITSQAYIEAVERARELFKQLTAI